MRYRWFADEEERMDEFGVPVSRAVKDEALPPRRPGYARGELLAIALAAVILIYEWVVDDTSMIFVCVSFLIYEMRPLSLLFLGPAGPAAANVMKGFSLAVFLGAVLIAFL